MKLHTALCALALTLIMANGHAASSLLLEELTWEEIGTALETGTDTIIIAIGATEQHGPQIALASDSIAGDYLAAEVAGRIGGALIAPNIRVGISPHHMVFPGTISIREEVLAQFVIEYAHSLVRHGFRHIAILPTHGGNFAAVEAIGQKLRWLYPHVNIIAFSDAAAYIDTMTSTSKRLGIPLDVAGSHAGMSETSMALAARPDLVRMHRSEEGFMGDAYGAGERMGQEGTRSVSPIGVLGDPRVASAEAGREYLGDLATLLTDFVRSARAEWNPAQPRKIPYGGLPDPQGPLAAGVTARRSGDFNEAIAFFEQRLQTAPQDPLARIELGRTLVLAGRYEEAREQVTPLQDSDDPAIAAMANDDLALIAIYQGRFSSAIAHKHTARQLAARQADSVEDEAKKLLQLGYIHTQIGQFQAAAEAFEESLQLAPPVSAIELDALHLYALLQIKQGRPHQAGLKLRKIGDSVFEEELASQVRRFYHLDAELLLNEGRPADALLTVPLAIQAYDHPLYRETQARAYLALERYREAEEELLHITRLTDARLDIAVLYIQTHFHLANLYRETGRTDEAAKLYQQFIDYWGNADLELDEIKHARAALAELAVRR